MSRGSVPETNKCETKIIASKTLSECPNEKLEPFGKHGPLVAKIPVVLAEPNIQIDVESVIKLEEPALEIKRIKKNLFLTQCKVIAIFEEKDGKHGGKCVYGKLFLKGFVRKNIEYATLRNTCFENGCISGDIRHTTCNIPFECVTKIDFVNPPEIFGSGFTSEVENFASGFKSCELCSHPLLGHDPCEQEFKHLEVFSEKVFCELVQAKIFEADIYDGVKSSPECFNEHTFESFTEKMVIFLQIKLLQNQQVKIPHFPTHFKQDESKDDCPIRIELE